jgi:hypothetical protein
MSRAIMPSPAPARYGTARAESWKTDFRKSRTATRVPSAAA